MVTFEDVQAAAERIAPFVVHTPLERSIGLSAACGVDVWLKLECFQRTGSFKLRGAVNALLLLDDAARARGVVTASAGNHGLGVARAARLVGCPATVVVADTASPAKIEALEHSGAELVRWGQTYDEAEAYALELAARQKRPFVSPYNDPAVVAGGGSVGLEIVAELPDVETVLVPAGGGGLLSGIGLAVHGRRPEIGVLGVQSVASPAIFAAHQAGRAITVPVEPSLADGLAGNIESTSITIDLFRAHSREIVLVEEAEIAAAMRWLLEHEHVLVEGSAAVGVAAALTRRVAPDGPTAIVLSGRNVAAAVLRQYVLG
jgi:threonine dehydratase